METRRRGGDSRIGSLSARAACVIAMGHNGKGRRRRLPVELSAKIRAGFGDVAAGNIEDFGRRAGYRAPLPLRFHHATIAELLR